MRGSCYYEICISTYDFDDGMKEKRDTNFSFFIFVFFHKRAGMAYNELEVVNKGFILSDLGNKKER